MTKSPTRPWLPFIVLALGCGGQMAPDEDTGDGGGANSGSGGATYTTTTYAMGGATVTTSWGTTWGGATVVTNSAVGGYGTTTVVGSGGMVTTSTSVGACSAYTNLVAEATVSTSGNWIGGDLASTADNPCGVQGAIYAYSDQGLDNVDGTSDDTVQSPEMSPLGWMRLNPCVNGRCCISGTTHNWPIVEGIADYTAPVWGGGIGVNLNNPGAGGAELPYSGPVKGFNVTITGRLSGQVLRIGYTQVPDDSAAPFVEKYGFGMYAVPFTGVGCATWATVCTPPSPYPYDLQIQVVGGDVAGPFQVCVTSITPIL